MQVVYSAATLCKALRSKWSSVRIGFVPTMGNLHEGHLALLRKARQACDYVVCSVYVNPIQFESEADYEKYPRTLKRDQQQAAEAGCDLLFCPNSSQLYAKEPVVIMDFGFITETMEGLQRPGHFSGVAIVVSKLFHLVRPDVAYFGEKDWQQCLVIRQLVFDLGFNIQLVFVPTVRTASGLAYASRNTRLSTAGRKKANILSVALRDAIAALQKDVAIHHIHASVCDGLKKERGVTLEYFEMVDSDTLTRIYDVRQHKSISLCIAAYIDGVRLIDNMRWPVDKIFSS